MYAIRSYYAVEKESGKQPSLFRTWDPWNLFSMSSIEALYLTFLTTGFVVGFGHCIGMCGPIVVSFSLNLKTKGSYNFV